MSFLSLSNELLYDCFSYLEDDKSDIRNLRLVSKRVHANASPFLITEVNVSFNDDSLRNLETLSSHPIFSKSIKRVQIDVSYYDELLAESCHRFVEHNVCELGRTLDLLSRGNWWDDDKHKEEAEAIDNAECVNKEWAQLEEELGKGKIIESSATEAQRLLLAAHETYVKLHDEQQEVLGSGQGVKRAAQAVDKITGLNEIAIYDFINSKNARTGQSWTERMHIEGLIERSLEKSGWKGSFITAMDTRPPVHIVGDLFTTLAGYSVRPNSFTVSVTAPADMHCIEFSTAQLEAVITVLGQVKKLHLQVHSWARKDSMAENNYRSAAELAGFCALTRAFFSSSRLKEIEFQLGNYPYCYQVPTISFSDIVPIPLPSANVSEIIFNSIPFKLSDFKKFFDSTKSSLESLELGQPCLLDGQWADGIEILRDLEKLDWIDFTYPHGGEYGVNSSSGPHNKQDAIEEYIIRESAGNPLRGWNPDDDVSREGEGEGLETTSP